MRMECLVRDGVKLIYSIEDRGFLPADLHPLVFGIID